MDEVPKRSLSKWKSFFATELRCPSQKRIATGTAAAFEGSGEECPDCPRP